MRNSFRQFVLVFLLPLGFGLAARGVWGEALPEYRPALLGHHARSLVNLIDTQSLMKHSQGDSFLMFETAVNALGRAYDSRTYRESPNSDLLRREVLGRLNQAQFEPAVYNRAHVAAYIQGTISFVVRDGKPRLAIFLHQEENELKSGRDFIAPQFAFVPGNSAYKGMYAPRDAPRGGGLAALQLDIDTTGRVTGAKVSHEHPPGRNIGAAAATAVRDARFIPAFRNGKPVACRFTWTMIYAGPARQMPTG